MILRRGKKAMPFGKKDGPVAFNRDITPGESGLRKSGVAKPNMEQGAASSKGKRPMARAKKRSEGKRM